MSWQKKSPGEASRMLAEYEALNPDLPKATRTQLAIFVLLPKVGKEALDGLFGRPLGSTPTRHRSWMWYTAICTSDMPHLWPEFRSLYNSGENLHACLIWLRDQASSSQWETLSRRLGIPAFKPQNTLNPYWWSPDAPKTNTDYWTAGGVWDRRNPYTRIICLGEHLPNRDHSFNQVSQSLTPHDCRQLESELYNLIDPERDLYDDCITRAVDYIRHRIPSLLLWKREVVGYKTASWFFQAPAPHPQGGSICYTHEANYPVANSHGPNPWLPRHEES